MRRYSKGIANVTSQPYVRFVASEPRGKPQDLCRTRIKVIDHVKMANMLKDYFSEIGQKWQVKLPNHMQLTPIPQIRHLQTKVILSFLNQ